MTADSKKEFVIVVPGKGLDVIAGARESATNEIRVILTPVPSDVLMPDVKEPKSVILKYEFEMYFMMRSIPGYEGSLRNAIIESAALDARILCNFFCGFDKPGDIRLGQIFDKRENRDLSALIKRLKEAYNKTRNGVNPGSPLTNWLST
jgi:hypothetical protein